MHPPDAVMLAGTLIPLLSILLGGLLLIIPVAGATVRFALGPAIEALERIGQLRARSEEILLLQRRVALLEQQLQSTAVLRMLEDGQEPLDEGMVPGRGRSPDGIHAGDDRAEFAGRSGGGSPFSRAAR